MHISETLIKETAEEYRDRLVKQCPVTAISLVEPSVQSLLLSLERALNSAMSRPNDSYKAVLNDDESQIKLIADMSEFEDEDTFICTFNVVPQVFGFSVSFVDLEAV